MRVYKNIFKLGIFIIVATLGLMINGTLDKEVLASTDKPVELYYAKYQNMGYNGGSSYGYICVKNLGYYKNIKVCYSGGEEKIEQPAIYVKTNPDGTELWRFDTILNDKKSTEFSIKYEVNGQTYWDNNNGKNYNIYYYPETFNFGKNKVVLDSSFRTVTNSLGVVLQEEGIPGNKEIKIRYTEDNWNTYKDFEPDEGGRGIEATKPNGVIYKHANIPIDENTKKVEFALYYVVDGVEYWDNNFGQNYTVNFEDYYYR